MKRSKLRRKKPVRRPGFDANPTNTWARTAIAFTADRGTYQEFGRRIKHWGVRNKRAGSPWRNGTEFAHWFTKYVLGHNLNRLPVDHPMREVGLSIDPVKVMGAIQRHGALSLKEEELWEATMERILHLRDNADPNPPRSRIHPHDD